MHTTRNHYIIPAALATLTLVSLGVMLWVRSTDSDIPRWLPTGLASTGFVLMAVARRAWRSSPGRWVMLALVWCWVGDMVGPHDFLVGVAAFLVGHLAFIVASIRRTLRRHLLEMAAIPVVACSIAMAAWLLPHVAEHDIPLILAYTAVITCMWFFACGAAHSTAGRLALIGATVFFISDIFVARWRYVVPSGSNAFFCYPLYYVSCLIFAWSTGFDEVPSRPERARTEKEV